jgi:hypothetical protein
MKYGCNLPRIRFRIPGSILYPEIGLLVCLSFYAFPRYLHANFVMVP